MTDQTRPDIPLTANEAAALDDADQQRQRAETAEAERDQAHNALIATRQMTNDANAALRDRLLAALGIENDGHTSLTGYVDALTGQLARLHEQLADAHAAGARSATQRDEARTTAEAMTQSVKRLVPERDRLIAANKAIIGENHNVREQLDRANTERQTLAQELATMTAVARSNKQHVATLTAIVERVSTLVDRLHHEGLATVHTEELCQALNAPVPAAGFPGSSRRAQADPLDVACAIEFFEEHGQPLNAAAVRDLQAERDQLRAAQADPSAPPPGWGYMARAEQLLQLVRPLIAGPVPVVSFAELAEAVDRVDAERAKLTPAGVGAAQGWDPTTPQWAVIRAATAWRLWYGGHYDPTVASACNDLAEAVDALPHIGEQRADLPTYGDDAPGTLPSRP